MKGLSSILSFANPNNDSTPNSSITLQTPLKVFETPSTKSIPDLIIGLVTPTKEIIENAETNSSEKKTDTKTQYEKIKVKVLKKTFCKIYVITLGKYLTPNLTSSNLNRMTCTNIVS